LHGWEGLDHCHLQAHPFSKTSTLVEIAYFEDGVMDFCNTLFVGLVAKDDATANVSPNLS
jgi:hypothetical protein